MRVVFGKENILVRLTMVKLAEVKLASDVTLEVAELEKKRKEARAKIKVAQKHLTQEVNVWEKQLSKFEGKMKKEGSLTQSARSFVESSSKHSQESKTKYLAVVMDDLDSLVFLCGNLQYADSVVLNWWLDGLMEKQESQRDSVTEAIELLGEKSEQLIIQTERKREVVAVASPGGDQVIRKPSFTFRSIEPLRPFTLVQEIRPSEFRAWELKYEKWFRCSLQSQPPAELEVDTFLLLVDLWWLNRLQPKCKVGTTMGDLRGWVSEEMRILYPISRR